MILQCTLDASSRFGNLLRLQNSALSTAELTRLASREGDGLSDRLIATPLDAAIASRAANSRARDEYVAVRSGRLCINFLLRFSKTLVMSPGIMSVLLKASHALI